MNGNQKALTALIFSINTYFSLIKVGTVMNLVQVLSTLFLNKNDLFSTKLNTNRPWFILNIPQQYSGFLLILVTDFII